MSQINHNISTPNDGFGDQLRTAFGNQNQMNTELYENKVEKITGAGLSSNDYSDLDKSKVDAIVLGAEVNVQSDWEQGDSTQDSYIKNKPLGLGNIIEVTSFVDLPVLGVAFEIYVTKDTDKIYRWNGVSYSELAITDISGKANLASPTFTGTVSGITKTMVGLSNVDNTTDLLKPISNLTQTALNNKADLVDGVVPSYQLPSYVDDVLEVANYAALPLAGEIGKIYVTLDNNKIYRWSGSIYIEIASNSAIWGAITGTLSNQTDLQNALNAKVPYTGAISNVNLGEYGLSTGNIQFDTTPTVPPTTVGSLSWNDSDGTLNLSLKGESVTLQIGQETVARIVNKTATNITLSEGNYQAVRVTGAIGQRPKVDLALADNDLNSTTTLGLVTETILINQEGFITTSGQVRGINTTGSLQGETWLDGDILYLSGTIAGQITNIKPVAPIHTVIIGFVEYAHITQGKIFVKVDNGYELDELHNVSAIAPNNNEVLTYDSATTLWKPKTVITALGYTPENIVNKSTLTTLGISNTLYPTQNAVKTYVDSKISYGDFANVVYFNSTNPSTATIFDLNNPPVLNDNALKADTGNLYIGTDNSTWTYKTSPAGYYTYTITSSSSNFYLLGTTTDAGNNKISAIQRNGSIKSPKFITTGGTSSQFVKGDGTLDSAVYAKNQMTQGYVPVYNSVPNTFGNSNIYNNGTNVLIGGTVDDNKGKLAIKGGDIIIDNNKQFNSYRADGFGLAIFKVNTSNELVFNPLWGQSLSAYSFTFGGDEKMRITSGGNVGIGTTSPQTKLTVGLTTDTGATTTSLMYLAGYNNATNQLRYMMNHNSANNAGMGTPSTGGILFGHGNVDGTLVTEYMRMTPAGNVGIGTVNPTRKLQVNGVMGLNDDFISEKTGNLIRLGYQSYYSSGGFNLVTEGGTPLSFGTASLERFRISASGAATFSSLGTGTVYSSAGTLTNTNPSDIRLKDNITDLQYGLNEILQLRTVTYSWKNDIINQGKQFGFIAQEVQEIMPDLVKEFETKDGDEDVIRLGLDKEAIFVILVQAIKELNEKIKILESK